MDANFVTKKYENSLLTFLCNFHLKNHKNWQTKFRKDTH